jgi:hypothetical protein
MKNSFLLATIISSLGLAPAFAQLGPQGGGLGPNLGGSMGRLFGTNQAFAAAIEFQTAGPQGGDITMPGKVSFDGGKSRFEMNMSEVKGSEMSPAVAQQMKAMGMDSTIFISRPDLKAAYVIYPGLNSYTVMALQEPSSSAGTNDYKVETAELGKETVDGHDCTKDKVIVTDKDGNKSEYTVWNATDLKNFPLKIVTTNATHPATITFKNVSFTKPAGSLFDAPSGYTKYEDAQTMLQTEMMKKLGGGAQPPAHP